MPLLSRWYGHRHVVAVGRFMVRAGEVLELLSVPAVIVADRHYSYDEAPEDIKRCEVEEIDILTTKDGLFCGAYIYVEGE